MKSRRFACTLESVRTVREHSRQLAMRQLADELDRAAELGAEPASTESDLSARQAYLERCERELVDARQRSLVQAGHVERGRHQLASATIDRETLDRLADRQRAAHVSLERRAERNDSDEISLAMRRLDLGGVA